MLLDTENRIDYHRVPNERRPKNNEIVELELSKLDSKIIIAED